MTEYYSKTRLFRIWCNMRQRCRDKNKPDYKYYGGKGVTVCKEWEESFLAFKEWAYANGYNDNLTIDRIDTNGDYEPSNCKWSTRKEQTRNRTITLRVTYNGFTKTAAEWAEEIGISEQLISERLRKGFPVERVLSGQDLRADVTKPSLRKKVVNLKDHLLFESINDAAAYYGCTPGNVSTLLKYKKTWIKLTDYLLENNIDEGEALESLFLCSKLEAK